MVDFGKSDETIKISRKVDKSNTYKGFSSNILFFIKELLDLSTFSLIFFYHNADISIFRVMSH